jgi:hypothetical protein
MALRIGEAGAHAFGPVDAEGDCITHPGRRYERPADVLGDASLTLAKQRAILSAWASDACAVVSTPPLRRAPFAPRPVTFDEVMDALVALDRRQAAALPVPVKKAKKSKKASCRRHRPSTIKRNVGATWPRPVTTGGVT